MEAGDLGGGGGGERAEHGGVDPAGFAEGDDLLVDAVHFDLGRRRHDELDAGGCLDAHRV